ncbi:MAG TPA: serine/threonine-protein kinase [Kofleriaceae bacterium]|nr:serine/threonine-protein kinase [Kofleriaceae bacterium]
MAAEGPLLGGRWRLGPRLGKGAQADTYLATEIARRQEVVVKRVRLGAGWKSFELHEREAKVLGQLRHAGIPRLFGAVEEPPGVFNLVMQRMPGENLRDLTKRKRLSENELRDVLIRGLEILDYLATRSPPVVHRDIKPSNLVRDTDGTLALVDFGGVAETAGEGAGSTLVGTYGYMAPEQLHGQATPATDLYALGATIVALAGGIEPEDVPRKGLKMDLAKHLPSMPTGLRRTLEAMTEPDPEKRPQRPREVVAMLAKAWTPEPARKRDRDHDRDRDDREEVALVEQQPRAIRPARPLFGDIPEPLGAFLRLSVLGIALGGWVGMALTAWTLQAIGWTAGLVTGGKRSNARRMTNDVAHIFTDGRDGFGDLARRAVARKRR